MIVFKITGMFFLFLSSVFCSKQITSKIKKRVYELEEIDNILNDFIVSINVGLYDVSFLLSEAIKRTKTKYHDFLCEVKDNLDKKSSNDFSKIWFDCLKNYHFDITLEEKILLENIGASLSFNDKNRMIKQLTLLQTSIENQIQKARKDKDTKVSLYEKMGVLVGGFLVIIFI